MTAHDHTELVASCYRCDLGRDEAADSEADQIREAARGIRYEAGQGAGRPQFLGAIAQWLLVQSSIPVSYGHEDGRGVLPRIGGPDPHALAIAQAYLEEG